MDLSLKLFCIFALSAYGLWRMHDEMPGAQYGMNEMIGRLCQVCCFGTFAALMWFIITL